MIEYLTSPQNPKIKNLIQLRKRTERQRQNLILVEGVREVERAWASGWSLHQLFFWSNQLLPEEKQLIDGMTAVAGTGHFFAVNAAIVEKIALRENSSTLIATFHNKPPRQLTLGPSPLLLVSENVEKPGNLGAMLRSVDGAGADGIVLSGTPADLWNPNCIRSSLGTVFHIPAIHMSTAETITWLRKQGIQMLLARLDAKAKPYAQVDMTGPTAIVMGSEANGLTEEWLEAGGQSIMIPMAGIADSLNLSVAAAILLYEARRQRTPTSFP